MSTVKSKEETKMKINEMKEFIKENGKAHLVKELVTGMDMDVESAVEYVYDTITLTREEFASKYLK